MAEKLGLRGRRGLTAPQLDISKPIILFWFQPEDADGNPPEAYSLLKSCTIKGCRPFCSRCGSWQWGRLFCRPQRPRLCGSPCPCDCSVFHKRWGKETSNSRATTPSSFNMRSNTNGIMFYDRINPNNPFEIKEGLLILE